MANDHRRRQRRQILLHAIAPGILLFFNHVNYILWHISIIFIGILISQLCKAMSQDLMMHKPLNSDFILTRKKRKS